VACQAGEPSLNFFLIGLWCNVCRLITIYSICILHKYKLLYNFIGRPFVKWFALCYRTVVLSVCLSVCNVGVLWPNGWMDQDETWRGGRPRLRPHCVRWRPSSPQRGTAPNFRPMSIVVKRLCGLRCQLVWRSASAQATLCKMGTQLPPKKGVTANTFRPYLLWPNGWMD